MTNTFEQHSGQVWGQVRPSYVLAFDTANEVISIAIGLLHAETQTVDLVAFRQVAAHRASNTQLLPNIDELLSEQGISRENIACVTCGRGPGSFTGVRICMATAKGVASALEVPLVGVSTLDALAWELQAAGVRGQVLVVADAMRKEVYPQAFSITDASIGRSAADTVVAASTFEGAQDGNYVLVAGDALAKYADIFVSLGPLAPENQWRVQGPGLLAALQDAWQAGDCDPFDAQRHDPAFLLPVYTRLSDAEEHEREKLAESGPRDLRTGVDGDDAISYQPFAAADIDQAAALEAAVMGTDAWNAAQFADELPRKDRTWWAAHDKQGALVGYAGGQVLDGQLQIFKVACAPEVRRAGVARELVTRLAEDARNLGAAEIMLEVRATNEGAHAFYEALGLESLGQRPGYYSDGEDAIIMQGPLPAATSDVAGMEIISTSEKPTDSSGSYDKPLILAIETSCDETAAALVDGTGAILSDAIASQIDFHARFGGVVPEIASRKHIEAICGVTQVCLEQASVSKGDGGEMSQGEMSQPVRYRDLDAIACTYAPGLVGALVVGVAFAKGAAWGANIPYIQVNHLEGHLYANKLATPDIQPPMVVSLVSGGHTMLVHVRDWGAYEILGSTIDDAVGEAFDKVAKALGLGYPGGPIISRYAAQGNPQAIDFPRAMLHSHDFRFSLSGLKTAVVTYIAQQQEAGRELNIPDIAASFQAAVIDVQVAKAKTALEETGAKEFCLGGGVAANPALRAAYETLCAEMNVRLTLPPLSACTDNASMIALVALDRFAQHSFAPLSADAFAHSNLEESY